MSEQWTAIRRNVHFPHKENELSLLPDVQTGSGVKPAYQSMGTRGSFTGGKADGA